MIPVYAHRAARALLVVAVILFFAAPIAFGDAGAGARGHSPVAQMVKAPVKILADLAIAHSKVERHVSSSILHAGVDLFTRALRRLLPEEDRKDDAPSDSRPRR